MLSVHGIPLGNSPYNYNILCRTYLFPHSFFGQPDPTPPMPVGLMALCNAASLLYAVSQVPIERRPSVVHPNVTPFVVNRWTGIQGQDPESADNNFVREHNLLCMVELNWGP